MTRTPIFKDQDVQEQFERDGFVKIKLFEVSEILALQNLFKKYIPDEVNAFFSSSYLDDNQLKREMSEKVTEVIAEHAPRHFQNFRLIGSAFLVKGTGERSEMPMHQDWTIVDESQYFAANVWIPLTKTDESNGTIEVLKGSQNWNKALRAPTLPFYFQGYEDRIKPSLTVINAELGEVVVLNQAVIHYSKANLSKELRPAITCGLISKEAPLKFHYWNADHPGKVELFEQEDDFLLAFENFHEAIYQRPTMGVSKGMIDYEIPKMDERTLTELVGVSPVLDSGKPGFIARLFGKS